MRWDLDEERTRPRKRFDREYATEWRKERDWLEERGIRPTFVKRVRDGVERYKYRKTADLFENLAVFYGIQEAGREWIETQRAIAEHGVPVAPEFVDDLPAALRTIARVADHWEDDTI